MKRVVNVRVDGDIADFVKSKGKYGESFSDILRKLLSGTKRGEKKDDDGINI